MSTYEKKNSKEQTWADETQPGVTLPGETKGGTARSVSTMSASSSDADILSFTSSAAISDFHTHKCNPFYDVRWFVFFFYIVTLSVYGVLAHNVAIARTLERRFGFSSFQVGFISSFNDIINLFLVLFIGYFGGKFSKPRMLGVMCLIGCAGCMLFALPYALYPRDLNEELAQLNANDTKDRWFCGAVNETLCDDDDDSSVSNQAYGIMLIASALLGFGNAGLSILSVGYIDDNLPRNVAAFYIGIVSSAYPVGPLLGFILSTVTLDLPENLKNSYLEPDDPGYIGCWWLPYLIFGSLVLISAIPMLFCPKHLPHYYKVKARLRKLKKLKKLPSVEDMKPRGFKQKTKVAAESIWGVFTNVPYMTLVMSTLCCYYILPSIYQQVPKYLNIQFHISPSMASIYTGLAGALVSALSLVAVGWTVKKLKLETRGACAVLILSICGTQLAITAMMPWECDQTLLAGAKAARYDDSDLDEYYPACQSNCNCTGVSPVCNDRLDIAFISPCHAGCLNYNPINETYINCQCVRAYSSDQEWGGSVKEGLCEKEECVEYIYYLLGFVAFNIFTSMSRVGGLILQLRLVEKEMRSFTLGLTSFIHNGLVFIPGPIIFGILYDSTCLLWEKLDCTGEEGVCILYNMPRYRTYMHGIPLTILLGALLLAFALYCMIKQRTKSRRRDPESEDSDHGEPPRFGGGLGSQSDKGHSNMAYEDTGGVTLTSVDDTFESERF